MDSTLPRSRSLLLLVDFINPLQFKEAQDIAPAAVAAARATAALKHTLAAHGVAALYANDNYGVWRSEFRGVHERCLAQGGAAAEMARLLAPDEHDLTVLKPRHSAFHATPLALLLEQMQTEELIVVGLATDICVQFTAMDAFVRGFRLHVPADCTAAESAERKQQALDWMRRVLDAGVARGAQTAQRLLTPWRGERAEGA
jgi:nicotinamidase-related amidase